MATNDQGGITSFGSDLDSLNTQTPNTDIVRQQVFASMFSAMFLQNLDRYYCKVLSRGKVPEYEYYPYKEDILNEIADEAMEIANKAAEKYLERTK